MTAAVQTALSMDSYALPLDPIALADLPGDVFEVRHVLRTLDLDEDQIQAAEAAVELVRQGVYPGSKA